MKQGDARGVELGMKAGTRNETPAMLISAERMQLLSNAEQLLYETECENRCTHHVEGRPCGECPRFEAAANGYITCDGYEQEGVEAA